MTACGERVTTDEPPLILLVGPTCLGDDGSELLKLALRTEESAKLWEREKSIVNTVSDTSRDAGRQHRPERRRTLFLVNFRARLS